jgi:hypothetical protein
MLGPDLATTFLYNIQTRVAIYAAYCIVTGIETLLQLRYAPVLGERRQFITQSVLWKPLLWKLFHT